MSVDILSLGEAHSAAAFDLAARVFVESSTLHRALGIGLDEYRAYLRAPFAAMVGEGLSVVAVERKTGAICGCLVAADFESAASAIAPPARLAPLAALTAAMAARYRALRTPRPGEAVLVDMAAVPRAAAGRGLYRRMRLAAQDIARERGYRAIVGELSSPATQYVVLGEMGHGRIAEIPFATFETGGAYPFRAIADPPALVLAEGRLDGAWP